MVWSERQHPMTIFPLHQCKEKHSPPSPAPDFEHSFSSLADCSSKEKHICFDSFHSTNKYDVHLKL